MTVDDDAPPTTLILLGLSFQARYAREVAPEDHGQTRYHVVHVTGPGDRQSSVNFVETAAGLPADRRGAVFQAIVALLAEAYRDVS